MCTFPNAEELEAGASKLGEIRPLMEQGTVQFVFNCMASKLVREHHKLPEGTPVQDCYEIDLPPDFFGPELMNRVVQKICDETNWRTSYYDHEAKKVFVRKAVESRPAQSPNELQAA